MTEVYSPRIATLNVAFEAVSVLKDQACILTSAEIDAEIQYERTHRNREAVIKLLEEYRTKAEAMERRIEERKPPIRLRAGR